jgi:hypothetical protein
MPCPDPEHRSEMMTSTELHALIEETDPPYTIATRSGRWYQITDRRQVWPPPEFGEMICLAVPGKGVLVLRASAVESIQID